MSYIKSQYSINPSILSQYPISVLNREMVNAINQFAESKKTRTDKIRMTQCLSIVNTFCDVTATRFTIIDLNSQRFISNITYMLVGFIYDAFDASPSNKYNMSRCMVNLVRHLCGIVTDADNKVTELKFSSTYISDDASFCIRYYIKHAKTNKERIEYYAGWTVESSEGSKHNLNLTQCYNKYGSELTGEIHAAWSNVALREKKITLSCRMGHFNLLLNTIVKLFPTLELFNNAMLCTKINSSMENVFNFQLIAVKSKGLCRKTFYVNQWSAQLLLVRDVFIKHEIVGEPLTDLFAPKFKASGKQITRRTMVQHDTEGNAFNSVSGGVNLRINGEF